MKEKISAVIPCYNVQKFVMRCFESIYNQTYGFENLEVIFLDDLSTDNTWPILKSLQERFPQNVISIKLQDKRLAGGARNIGIDICSGRYITFIDADDYIHPEMLQVLFDRMLEDDYDIVQCENERFDQQFLKINEINKNCQLERLDLSILNNRKNMIITLPGLSNIIACGKLYSAKFLKQNNLRFLENCYFEDNYFSFMCVMLAKKYCKVHSKLYFYYVNDHGITGSTMTFSKIQDLSKNVDHMREELITRGLNHTIGSECRAEIQIFFLWKEYFEIWDKIKDACESEQKKYGKKIINDMPDIFENPYVWNFSNKEVLQKMDYLRKLKNENVGDEYNHKTEVNEVHIGFGLHDKDGDYSVWVGTTIQSIIEHSTSKIVFHILHDSTLNEINRRKLETVVKNSGNDIMFHKIEINIFDTIEMGRFSVGALFRVMLPSIIQNQKKIIYLDADLFVNRDIKELWDIDVSDYCLAAVRDNTTIKGLATPYAVAMGQTSRENYFNSGVLVMNLEKMRSNGNTYQMVMEYLKANKKSQLPDQDALNAIYAGKCLLLDEVWNYFIDEVRKVENTKLEKKIYHYAATKLALYFKNDVDKAYYQTILRTPWGEKEGEKQLSRSLIKMIDRIEQLELFIRKITKTKSRIIFYGDSLSMKNVMNMLNVKMSDCEFYETISENEIKTADEIVYIVSAEADANKGIEKLEKNGLKNGKDFFVTQRLVGPFDGGFLF